jgi:hypothetical protein
MFIRFNEMVIQKMNPRGNVKISYDQTFESFIHKGKSEPHPHIVPLLKSQNEIFFKEEGCNTKFFS